MKAPFAVGVLLALTLMSGCGYFFGPKADSNKPMQLKTEGLDCLDTMSADLGTWMKTGSPDPAQPVGCMISALDQFAERTSGRKNAGWSQSELAHFFSTYLEKKGKDPNLWLKEVLGLKQTLLGGSREGLSRDELARIKDWLKNALPKLQALSPHAPALFFRADKADRVALDSAFVVLSELTESLAKEIGSVPTGRIAFETTSIPNLLKGMEIEAPEVTKLLPLAEAVKAILVGGAPQMIKSSEWPSLIRVAGRLWIEALRVRYQINGNERALDRDFKYLSAATTEGVALLETAVAAHGSGKAISLEKWETLIDLAQENDLIPFGLSVETIKGLLPHVFGKLLYGNSKSDREAQAKGFGALQLAALKKIHSDWIESQSFIRDFFTGNNEFEAEVFAKALPGDTGGWRGQLAKLIGEGRPLHADEEGRLRVVSRQTESRLTVSDLTKINAVRTSAAAIIAGYAHDATAARELQGLTEAETQEVYLDVRALGRDLGLVDTRNTTAGARTFMEASIFTSFSIGDGILSLPEAVEWFHMAIGGGKIAGRIHEDMVGECGLQKLDVLGNQKLDTACFRRRLREGFGKYFVNLPNFVKWYEEGGEARANEVQQFLEKAARGVGYSDRPVDSAELKAMTPVLHYVENVFATRDAGNKGYLNKNELWSAYPVIQPFIKKVTGGKIEAESLQKAIFSWLIVFGEPPTSDIIGGGKILAWSVARHVWSEQATRLDILKIISSFTTLATRDREKRIADYFAEKQIWLRRDLAKGDRAVSGKVAELFQCQSMVYPFFAEAVRSRIDEVFPAATPGTVDGPKFIKGIKEIIASDQRLEFYCLPF